MSYPPPPNPRPFHRSRPPDLDAHDGKPYVKLISNDQAKRVTTLPLTMATDYYALLMEPVLARAPINKQSISSISQETHQNKNQLIQRNNDPYNTDPYPQPHQ